MKVSEKMKGIIASEKKKAMATTAALACALYSVPAYASIDITEDKISTMLNSTIDILFSLIAAGVGVVGVFQLVPAIIHFVQASQSNNGEQRKEAGSGIGTAVVMLMLAGAVFMLKTPLKSFFGLS
jgi:hypothetical protein